MLILSACANGAGGQNQSGGQGSQSNFTAKYAAEIDSSQIMTFEIKADAAAWQNMLDNAMDEEYIEADVKINGMTIERVGIRTKGNSSLSAVARDSNSDRYSFKIKFNEYVKDQTWLGLDKIVLNNNYSDASSMNEYLSYDIMHYIGVQAPLFAYADISVNGSKWGLYLAVEDMDSGYLERTKNGEGELYKPESNESGWKMEENLRTALGRAQTELQTIGASTGGRPAGMGGGRLPGGRPEQP